MYFGFCQKVFLYILRWSYSSFNYSSVQCWLMWILNHPGIPGVNLIWSWYLILLKCYWIQIINFCWRFLYLWFISILSVILACNFPFWGYLFDFDIRIMLALFNKFGSVLSSSKFWNSLRSINVEFSLNVWWNSPVKTHGSGLLY